MSEWMMTPNQIQWLNEVIEDHEIAASNERLWALGSDDTEIAEMHLTNAAEHVEFAEELRKLLGDYKED